MVRPVPGISIEQQPEGVVIRMTVYGEARGESPLGKLAVLWVLKNRALRNDTSLKFESLKPFQFSCYNLKDPNRPKLLTAWKDDPNAWRLCDAVAGLFELDMTVDPTHGATHYYVEDMPNPPTWGRGHEGWEETAQIGAHVFGRAS